MKIKAADQPVAAKAGKRGSTGKGDASAASKDAWQLTHSEEQFYTAQCVGKEGSLASFDHQLVPPSATPWWIRHPSCR